VVPQEPDVLFTDGVQESPLSIAQTVQALRAAEAASDKVLVGMVHPDWDEDDVDAEVALIQAERQAGQPPALPDPMFTHPDDNPDGGLTDGTAQHG
jgi:hypothetical protein